MASSKPPTTLKIAVVTVGSRESVADLFQQLNELGMLDRSQDVVLNVGFYFEEEGQAARARIEELLREHPAVLKTKSYTDLGTKRKVSDTFEPSEEASDDEDDDELPMERAIREAGDGGPLDTIRDFADRHGVESVTLSHRGRTVELTAETRKNAIKALEGAGS